MCWIAPSEKDVDNPALEKHLWDAAEQAVPAPHFAETDFSSARPEGLLGLDKQRLGELIDVIATIELAAASEGEKTHRSVDLLGRVYEYFLTRFASAEGKNGGQFYTPSCVVRCLVEPVPVRKDLAPYKGRICDTATVNARRLLTHAFASEIVNRITVEPVREHLEQVLWARLEELIEKK